MPGAAPKADTGKTERVMEHIDAAQTRKSSLKGGTKGTGRSYRQDEIFPAARFTDEERAAPELEKVYQEIR